MDFDSPSSVEATVLHHGPIATHSVARIQADDGVGAFVITNKIQKEYDDVLQQIEMLFAAELIHITVMPSFEEDSKRETLVFHITSDMDQFAFRTAMEQFFESIITSSPTIYQFIAVLRSV